MNRFTCSPSDFGETKWDTKEDTLAPLTPQPFPSAFSILFDPISMQK